MEKDDPYFIIKEFSNREQSLIKVASLESNSLSKPLGFQGVVFERIDAHVSLGGTQNKKNTCCSFSATCVR